MRPEPRTDHVRGRNYYPQEIESAASDIAAVRKGNVIAFGEPSVGETPERVTVVAEVAVS